MRRLASIAAFALLVSVPLWAQHGGGGHGGGGGHASGGSSHMTSGFGGHSSSFSGSHSSGFSGHASRPFAPNASAHGFSSRGPFLHDGAGLRLRTYGFRNPCYGYLCRGYGWGYYPWGWAYYDPSWWWDGSSNDDSYDQDVARAAEMNRENLEEQQMLRQEQADGDQDLYARSAPAPRQVEGQPMLPATVLVFRDKHQREIQNYAIVGQTLWNFAPQRTEKISLADIDLPATTKANDDRGLTFRLPTGEAR